MPFNNASDLIREVNLLASSWHTRQNAIRKWYDQIRLVDDLKQAKMESVISADPRTSFNMARWLLTPRTPAFAVDLDGLMEQEQAQVGPVEDYCNREYLRELRRSRQSLFGRSDQRLLSYMLATGWYSVISYPTPQGWVWGIWNPAGVFPDYDSEGNLTRVARLYRIPAREANAKIAAEQWQRPSQSWRTPVNVYTMWWTDWSAEHQDNMAWFMAVVGNHIAMPAHPTPFKAIPVHVGPVAGLPDDGTITQDDTWRAEIGSSLVAPIADVMKNYDKMLTYMQQLLRDTANPRWVERVRGGSVLDPEKLWQRGAVFTIEPGEDITPIATPPLPPEMRGHQFDLRAQIQRALFSDLSFGNVTQQVSAFLLTQVTAAAQQILEPFQQGLSSLFGAVATLNVAHARLWQLERFPLPDVTIDFKYDITIPGDFANRAQTARLLNPEFRLSTTTLMELLVPEVRNALIEKGVIQAEDALSNPVARQGLTIWQLQRAAQEARLNKDIQFATALERVAALLEQQVFGGTPSPGAGGLTPTGGMVALPPGIEELLGGRL